jgi:PHD/YefM family antitoxin component YafN of YafNO toxin-antitoxin module
MSTLSNALTIADIKRGGMAALDAVLNRGAVTIMKRNRPAAIVLTPAAYETLLAQAAAKSGPARAMDWLLNASAAPEVGTLEGPAMANRLADLSSDWPAR